MSSIEEMVSVAVPPHLANLYGLLLDYLASDRNGPRRLLHDLRSAFARLNVTSKGSDWGADFEDAFEDMTYDISHVHGRLVELFKCIEFEAKTHASRRVGVAQFSGHTMSSQLPSATDTQRWNALEVTPGDKLQQLLQERLQASLRR